MTSKPMEQQSSVFLTGRSLMKYHTKGPLQTLAISSDGRYVAGIEVPAVTAEGDLLGAYRLHIWDREK